jgi:hypothetical protein
MAVSGCPQRALNCGGEAGGRQPYIFEGSTQRDRRDIRLAARASILLAITQCLKTAELALHSFPKQLERALELEGHAT